MSHAPIRQDLYAGLVNSSRPADNPFANDDQDDHRKEPNNQTNQPHLPLRYPVPANDNRSSFAGEVAGFSSLGLEVARLLTGISSAGHKRGKDGDQ